MTFKVLVCAAAMAAISAGSAMAQGSGTPGKKQGDAPPRLTMKDGFRVWDNPAAFGPVPKELMETGRKVCATMNSGKDVFEPTGYHARALDQDGNEFQGGGYYCMKKK